MTVFLNTKYYNEIFLKIYEKFGENDFTYYDLMRFINNNTFRRMIAVNYIIRQPKRRTKENTRYTLDKSVIRRLQRIYST